MAAKTSSTSSLKSLRGAARGLFGGLTLLAASCAPQAAGPANPSVARQATTVDRPVHLGLFDEPAALGGKFGGGGSGVADYHFAFNAKLTHYDQLGAPMAVLAQEIPSLEAGSWQVFPDGRMATTYKLRSTSWHDGEPLTADDVLFTWQAIMNPSLPASDREPEKYIDSIDVMDPHTFVVRWTESYIFANSWLLEPVAKHILEPIVQRDATGFTNAPYWTREWVGLGPYKLTEWVPGSHLQGSANPDFALGAPKIRQVVAHFVPDSNQAVVSMLAGTIDVTLANLIRVEDGLIIKEQLEPKGDATVMAIPTKIRYGELQYRSPLPPPSRDARIRQALLSALDRGSLVGSLLRGLSNPADMYLAPNDAVFADADRVIAKYPFDPNRAQTVLQGAGWVRGAGGGVLVKEGERFDLELRTTEEIQNVKEVQIIGDYWKQIGVNPEVFIIPKAKQDDQEFRAKFPGVSFSATSISPDWMAKWQSDQAASDANRWRGNNRGAYSRPEIDQMYRQYITTIDPPSREKKLVEMVKFASEDVTYLPLYYQVDVHAIRAGLEGLVPRWPGQAGMAFNIYEWYWSR